jgi:dephospho-CoA kinase
VTYFGEQVLNEDLTLDRKKLSDIVFVDLEKRKKLESFTHPQIQIEFVRQLNEITSRDPNAIIQVVIPLLLELNLQHMFHKVLVVSVSQDEMAMRLAGRDGITQVQARKMLSSQLPMEEKLGFADFVIDNSGTLDQTRAKVEELWGQLKEVQKEIRGV